MKHFYFTRPFYRDIVTGALVVLLHLRRRNLDFYIHTYMHIHRIRVSDMISIKVQFAVWFWVFGFSVSVVMNYFLRATLHSCANSQGPLNFVCPRVSLWATELHAINTWHLFYHFHTKVMMKTFGRFTAWVKVRFSVPNSYDNYMP